MRFFNFQAYAVILFVDRVEIPTVILKNSVILLISNNFNPR